LISDGLGVTGERAAVHQVLVAPEGVGTFANGVCAIGHAIIGEVVFAGVDAVGVVHAEVGNESKFSFEGVDRGGGDRSVEIGSHGAATGETGVAGRVADAQNRGRGPSSDRGDFAAGDGGLVLDGRGEDTESGFCKSNQTSAGVFIATQGINVNAGISGFASHDRDWHATGEKDASLQGGNIGDGIKRSLNGRIFAATFGPNEGDDADYIINKGVVAGTEERGRSLEGIRHSDVGVGRGIKNTRRRGEDRTRRGESVGFGQIGAGRGDNRGLLRNRLHPADRTGKRTFDDHWNTPYFGRTNEDGLVSAGNAGTDVAVGVTGVQNILNRGNGGSTEGGRAGKAKRGLGGGDTHARYGEESGE